MSVTTIVLLAFSYVFSVVAFGFACRAIQKSPVELRNRLMMMELWQSDFETRFESLHAAHKKLNARIAARIAREGKSNPEKDENIDTGSLLPQPGETDAQWKARMRRKIVTGELKHAPD